ncbi:helicase-related protein, partial [Comamonas avium]|uniref:helicase-related protein n=1 Tax=Comamonas avium TaxID=2762231 RepID=UPI001CD8E553
FKSCGIPTRTWSSRIKTSPSFYPHPQRVRFAWKLTTLSALQIRCVSLVGADSAKRRQAAVDAFQDDPEVKVFIGSTMAAGVGITLTAANIVAFASMPWTPALMRQAEDRAYRLGQKRDVLVLVPIIPGTIDEGVLALQDNKRTTEEEVIEAAKMALPRGSLAR